MDYSAPLYENISIENEEMNSSQWTQFMQLRKEAWKKKEKIFTGAYEPTTELLPTSVAS